MDKSKSSQNHEITMSTDNTHFIEILCNEAEQLGYQAQQLINDDDVHEVAGNADAIHMIDNYDLVEIRFAHQNNKESEFGVMYAAENSGPECFADYSFQPQNHSEVEKIMDRTYNQIESETDLGL